MSYPEVSLERVSTVMIRSYWIIIFMLGLMPNLSLVEGNAQESLPSSDSCSDLGQGCDENVETIKDAPVRLFVPVKIIDDADVSERTEKRKTESDKREVEDLIAQKSMAQSTKQVVIISFVGLLITTAGTLAVLFTLFLGFRANKIAHLSYMAAARPWLGIVNPSISFLNFDDAGLRFHVKMKMRNTGNSPALSLRVAQACKDGRNLSAANITLDDLVNEASSQIQKNGGDGYAIFPNIEEEVELLFGLSNDEMTKSTTIPGQYDPHLFVSIVFAYKSPVDEITHYTGMSLAFDINSAVAKVIEPKDIVVHTLGFGAKAT